MNATLSNSTFFFFYLHLLLDIVHPHTNISATYHKLTMRIANIDYTD